jgi:hypothetical protein
MSELRHLSEDERLEYRELGEFCRHDETLVYAATATLLPLSFLALAVLPLATEAHVLLLAASVTLGVLWFITCTRLAWFVERRRRRAAELERTAGLRNHALHDWRRGEPSLGAGAFLSVRKTRLVCFGVLVLLWADAVRRLL